MYYKQKIIYKNEIIHTIDDLRLILLSEESMDTSPAKYTPGYGSKEPIMEEMSRMEHILMAQICPEKCPYLFKSMLEAQECLEALDFLETMKYACNVMNPRQLLNRYLYSHYDFSSCTSAIHRLHQEESSIIDMLHPRKPIGNPKPTLLFPEQDVQSSYARSVRNHINTYLTNVSISDDAHGQLGIRTIISRPDRNNITKRSFILPLYEAFLLLLLFTFYDGRDFSHVHSQKNEEELPPHKPGKRFSSLSYDLILQKLSVLYPDAQKEVPYVISTLYRCDKIFLFQKLNRLHYYYDMYQNSYTLERIKLRYPLSGDAETIRNALIQNIFNDKEFIIAGLKCRYLDFMLPFHIFFLCAFQVTSSFWSDGNDLTAFINKLMEVKEKTMRIWKISLPPQNIQNMFHFETNGEFSIIHNEERLLKRLRKNLFYTKGYINMLTLTNPCIDYEIIRSAMNINYAAFKQHDS